MKSKAIYDTLIFALILSLSGASAASAGTPGVTGLPVSGRELASISSAPPAASAAQKTSPLPDEMPPRRLPLAPRSLGLKLVGTVVAEDSEMSLAIIENEGGGKQRIYYEGARADKVLIKKILRNEVIIDAGRGEQRLTMLHSQPPSSERAPQQAARGQLVPQQKAESSQRLPGRHRTVRLDLKEVASALGDVNKVMQEVSLSPVTSFHRNAGFRITNIPSGSILSEMGLQNGAVIKAVDEETITNPEQVAKFLRRVKEGGQVTVTVNKRRRTQHIHLEIQ